MELGKNFSIWLSFERGGESKCAGEAAGSYDHYMRRYMSTVTNGQIRDGLDDFYKDFRNRSILIPDAMWIVVRQIAGDSKPDIEHLTEQLRRNAQGPLTE